MTYRDNEVYFTCNATGMSLVGGSYTIDSFFVTAGQDPNGKIANGKVFAMGTNRKFRFSVGRKKSASTANWFNAKVAALYTTFGHKAERLNFAFTGRLVLWFFDGTVYTFDDISFAQGNAVFSNNWWFGGTSCRNIGDNKVDCIGMDVSGKKCNFVFLRGGNGANEITITQIRKQYNNSGRYTGWMGQLEDDSLPLRDLTIPGTHDSGTKHASSAFGARCQNFDIEEQLKDGIRFLDIRLQNNRDMLDLCHGNILGIYTSSCYVSFGQVLVWCRDFLEANPGETILMSVKKEFGSDITDNFNNYLDGYKDLFLNTAMIPTLGMARGKIVLLKRFRFAKFGVDWFGDGGTWLDNDEFYITTAYGQQFRIFDKYKLSDTHEKWAQLEAILHDATRTADADNRKIFYTIFVSIAFSGIRTPYQYAWGGNGVNPAMNPSLIRFLESNPGTNKWGTVILDFYSDEGARNELVKMLIESNHGKVRNSEDMEEIIDYTVGCEYFVNLNPNLPDGLHHEIHRYDCKYLPALRNRHSLGFHLTFDSVIEEARKVVNADVDGCYHCCKEIHTK